MTAVEVITGRIRRHSDLVEELEAVLREVSRVEARPDAGSGAYAVAAEAVRQRMEAEIAELRRQNVALAERVAAQSELLSKRAEATHTVIGNGSVRVFDDLEADLSPEPVGNVEPPAPPVPAREEKPVYQRRTPGDAEREFRPASVYMLPILRVLGAATEPMSMQAIGERIGKDDVFFCKPFKACPWFECVNPDVKPCRGKPSLWALTDAGRAAFAKLPPEEPSPEPTA